MPLEQTVRNLALATEKLHEALVGVQVIVTKDKPLAGEAMLADEFGHTTMDLLSWADEMHAAAEEAEQGVGYPPDLDRLRRAVVVCQRHFNRIQQRFLADLISYDRVDALVQLGRERAGEWRFWTQALRSALHRCEQQIYEANEALFQGWQEIAERGGSTSVLVQATNIGQQVLPSEGKISGDRGT